MYPKEIDEPNDIRLEWQEIARNEVIRQRRQLALLSDEQRMAVESARVSVADQMFEVVVPGAETCPDSPRFRSFNVWRREAVAA